MQTQARSRPYSTAPAEPTSVPAISAPRNRLGRASSRSQSRRVWFQPARSESRRPASTSSTDRSRKLAPIGGGSARGSEDEVPEDLGHVEALAGGWRERGFHDPSLGIS